MEQGKCVGKDSLVIAFRGRLDSLCAAILEAQVLGEEMGNRGFVDDLQEILEIVRSILPAEYTGIPLREFCPLGYSAGEVREQSHNPHKYFNRRHLFMHYSMGTLSLRLNVLRTLVRETELAAIAALRDSRNDITQTLNGLSSLLYILMYKYLPEHYIQNGDAGI